MATLPFRSLHLTLANLATSSTKLFYRPDENQHNGTHYATWPMGKGSRTDLVLVSL